jgi:uncharacterized protein (TIGR02246 family)
MKSSTVALMLALAVASPSMAADLKADIVALEKSSWQAYAKHDAKAYGATMTDDAVLVAASGDVLTGRQKIEADLSTNPCDVKSFDLADTKVRQLSPDIAILTYTLTQDVTCDGTKMPAKAFATAVYVRQGGKWRWTSYQETVQK